MFSKPGIIIIFSRISFSFDQSTFSEFTVVVVFTQPGWSPCQWLLKPGPPRHFFPSRRRRRFSSPKSSQDLEVLYLPQAAMCVFKYGINTLHEYASGGSLVRDDNPRRRLFAVRRELTCQMSMEVPYYSAKRVKLPSVCFHCGGNSGAVLVNDADIIELQNIQWTLSISNS